ncbi:hypothetical protein ACFQ7N_22560 [Streptomyces niveus]|uniref:hypothetical protein n=1 Tax=Streptomyces niveus TaxID=193462 RepID=UPI00368EAF45
MTFLFPGSTDGAKNNVTSRGIVIAVPHGHYRRLRLLGACHGGSVGADAVAACAVGTTGTVKISLTDWGRTPAYGEAVAPPVRRTYRSASSTRSSTSTRPVS